ncbi:MAG: hypothetical protein KIS96_13895 [Bauldia sp.]|nr:hypothetical protein [Bauldia sp.]
MAALENRTAKAAEAASEPPQIADPAEVEAANRRARGIIFTIFPLIGVGIGLLVDALTGETGLGLAIGVAVGVGMSVIADWLRQSMARRSGR